MDQRSDNIRQDIESTRAALDEKLDTLETKARQTFDLKHQVAERPWMMLGAAVAAGYVLGSLGGGDDHEQRWQGQPMTTTDYNQHATRADTSRSSMGETVRSGADSFLSQFDDEIDMLKTAAMATLSNFLRDAVKEYVPALGRQLDQTASDRGKTRSTAPGASRSELSGASKYYDVRESPATANYESIPETTSYGSNMVDRDAEHATPYYPPGSSGARERSVGEHTT
ncbi:MAG: hypothetical protein IPO81_07040 [Kouleothrix sp.]|nr:hypothetical protein [Kouleothrix sp.]